jgi:hypothetical protein
MVRLKLSAVPLNNTGQVKSMRLVRDGQHAALATLTAAVDGSPTVSLAALDHGTGSHIVSTLESPFGIPSWDIAGAPSGFALVWTEPGSAICPLGYRLGLGQPIVLTGRYASGVFQSPRFVRGERDLTVEITAVAYEGNTRVMALFSSNLESGHSSYSRLLFPTTGILQDGLLLRKGNDYILLVETVPPGPRAKERRDGRGESIIPGVLQSLNLNSKLEPAGLPLKPFGDTPVYEFDAEIHGGEVFLLATTQKGYVAARDQGHSIWAVSSEVPTAGELVSPAAVSSGDIVHAAVIEAPATPRSQILEGKF